MLVSYTWLQSYFDQTLPEPEKIAHALLFGAFEVDSIEKKDSDVVLDVKVLPNRAHDCLSHRGIAREISGLLDIPLREDPLREQLPPVKSAPHLTITVSDQKRCPVYAAAHIRGIDVKESPAWLKERLTAIGQRPINNIVDATNYVMFDLGTPLHVFDAEKLGGDSGMTLGVRAARDGETIRILGGTELTLSAAETVITDNKDTAIAIAGVKGGNVAELTSGTTDIIIEAAKFDPVITRRAAQRLNLRTDASKRFENEIADDLPLYGLEAVVKLIIDIAGGDDMGRAVARNPRIPSPYKLGVALADVNRILGTVLVQADVERAFRALGLPFQIVDPLSTVLKLAPTLVGAAYTVPSAIRYDAPKAFSCSSFTNYLYVQGGIALPSMAVDQYLWTEPADDRCAGDLIFSNSGEGKIYTESVAFIKGRAVPAGVDHVGMYLGDGKVIHATRKAGAVVIEDLETSSSFKNIVGWGRVVTDGESRFVVTVPFERLDLRIPEDLIEEIGRVYGYEHIGGVPLSADQTIEKQPAFYWADMVRDALTQAGFSEAYTYSLRSDGIVRLANSLAADKNSMRKDLSEGVAEALGKNALVAPLLGEDVIRIFEIGTVFPSKDREDIHIAIGVAGGTGKTGSVERREWMQKAGKALTDVLGLTIPDDIDLYEFNLSELLSKLPEPPAAYPKASWVDTRAMYEPFSSYPFVLRDLALWVSAGQMNVDDIRRLIVIEAGELLMRCDLFDEFTKDDKISYAFHLVFQSKEKTLTDDEVNAIMEKIEKAVAARGWVVR